MNENTPPNRAVDAGVFVAAFVLLLVSIAQDWSPLAVLSGVVLIGVMVTNAARRQQRPSNGWAEPEERPWQRGSE